MIVYSDIDTTLLNENGLEIKETAGSVSLTFMNFISNGFLCEYFIDSDCDILVTYRLLFKGRYSRNCTVIDIKEKYQNLPIY